MPTNLVTGGSGFLGSHLIDALLARREPVRALVRRTSDIAHLKALGVELVYGDLIDPPSLRAAALGVDRVYHCAALAADWGSWEAFRAANVTGVRNLLQAALEAGVARFIHVSTTDVYGHPDRPVDESAPYRLRGWPYGDTKIEGEGLVWAYHHGHGLPVTVVRSATFVLEIVALLRRGEMIHLGRRHRPAGLTYVTDAVDLVLRAAGSDRSVGQAYNAVDDSDVTWRQYVDRLAAIVGVPGPRVIVPYRLAYLAGWAMEAAYGALHVETRPLLTRLIVEVFGTHQGFAADKARRELGWAPTVGFDEGMRRVEAWLRDVRVIA
jgi:nucleoside-diphosphate-sugar epimerase